MPYQITTGKDGKPEVVVSGFDPAKAKNPAQVAETPQQLRMAEAGLRMLPGGDVGVSAAKGAAAGVQELFRTGNIGKAQAAYQQGFVRDISVNANPVTRMAVKGARDLTQSVLGNLPADEFARTGLTAPRKPGAPDAPILGIMPPLPKVQTKGMVEDIGAGLIQGGVAWFLATKGLRAAGGAAMRAPGAAAVAEAAAPVTQAARTATAFAKGAPGATGVATKVATKAAKLVLEGAPAGAIVDYAAFDPGESGRISDGATKWINTLPDPLRDAAHNLVLSKPGDTAADARWKNAVEGFTILGPAAAGVIYGLGRLARASVRTHQARVANRPPEPPAGGAPPAAATPEPPAAAQTVDVTAAPAAPPKAPPKGPAPAAPKAPARAAEIAKQYQEMRPRQPLWEKTEVQTQGAMGLPRDPWGPAPTVAEAQAELRTAIDAVDTSIAKASSTVPDELGPVPAVERGNVMPSYSQVKETPVGDIATDPVRLQFKAAGIGKTGTTGSLKSAASYDPLFGKIVSVWRDPQTNQLFVVNGHNRLDLARRSGTKSILTWEIDAATAEEARAIGAMENIAEGQGTPWDAAKIMRDMGINAEEMVRRNIDVTKGVAEKGVALSRLPQDVFEQGVTGKLTLDKAVALGSEKLDDAVVRDVAAAATKSGWSAEKILQAMQEAKFAQTSGPSGGGVLPGFESMFETSNFGTMLDVRTEAFKALREEMIALTSLAKEGRKGIIESAGNVVNVAGSQAAKGQAQAAVDVFNRVTGYTGPVRDLLNEMAGQVGGKRTAKAVVTENLARLKAAIEDEMKGPRLPLEQPPAAAVAPSVPSAGTSAPDAPPAAPAAPPKAELPDTRGQGQFFHGAAAEIKRLDEGYYETMNIYGQGFYTTDDVKTAGSYTKKNVRSVAKSGGIPGQVIYQAVEREPVRFYDLDAPASPSVKQDLERSAKYFESVALALDEFDTNPKISLAKLMDEIRANSRGVNESADTIQEVFEGLRETLQAEGYGGFTHVGGKLTKTGREHQVKIYWSPETQLELKRYEAPAPASAPEPRVAVQPMGNAAAAAIEPPTPAVPARPTIDIPESASRRVNPNTPARTESAAESLFSWTSSPLPGAKPVFRNFDEALAAIRAKDRILDIDAVPGLDMDAARNDKALGKVTPATQAVANAYEQFYKGGGRAELTSEAVRRIMPDKLPDALRADPGLTEATKKLMVDTVRRIAGDDIAITFENGIVLKPGSKAHGTEGQLRRIGGGYSYKGIGDPIEEAIAFHEMGLLAKDGQSAVDYTKDKLEVASHEAFHAAQLRYMSSAQLKVLDTAFAKLKLFFAARNMRARAGGARPRPIETTAQAFESFDQAAQAGVSPGAVILGMSPDDVKFFTNVDPKNPLLKSMGASDRVILSGAKTILAGVKLVDDMFDFMEKLYNAMNRRGWTSIRSIFEEAASGKLKETPGMAHVKSDVSWDDAKEWAQRVKTLDRLGAPGMKAEIEFAKSEGLLSERSTLASEGPVEPQGPRPVDPPAGPENNDDWVRRFAQELERNREALIRGDITMEDLMANNFQKVQSPSGNIRYATASEDLVSGYDAMTKVLPGRQIQSGFGLFSAEETAFFVQSWYTRHGADQELVTNGLMPLIRGFNEYQVGDLNRAMALADKKQVEASMEAAMWLNSANAEGVNQSERLARLVTAANAARTMHTAVMKVTRPWGQLGREMQMPRDYVIPPATGVREAVAPPAPEPLVAAAIPDVQSLDVGGEIVREIEIETARPIEETFSDDLREAVAGGEITPKAQAEADTLAQTLVSAGAEPSMREKTWGSFDVLRSTSSGDLGPLLMLRTNNLISSGVTANTNFINGMFNLARLPLSQVAGAVATGELKRAMYSMMMFQQYWMNLSNAFRVAGHSLKAGRSLMNMDVSTLDWMDRAAAKDAQGELLGGPDAKTGWTINTVNMSAEMAKKPLGMTINALWQVLGTGASRLAIGIDTFNSTLAGYAYEHVRHLPRGMDLATERGMAEFSSEAWRFAQEYANARTQATMRDAVINGKNLADVAMESPHAKDFMNAVNFTDDVWSEMQTRSLSQGISIGESQGLKGQELTDFAQKYVDEGQAQHRLANFAMNGPVPFGRLGSLPGEAMATLSQAKLVGPIFKFIQPFQRVPSNIIKSAMRGTPAAVFVDTFWRDIVSEDAFTRDRAIGEVALGSAVLSLVAMGSAMGYVRFNGGGPLDPAAKEKWSTIEGRMPYSVQVWDEAAGKWSVPTSMQAVEPYATLFGAIGDYTDIANSLSTEQRNQLGSALVMELAQYSVSGILNKTYFQGFNEVYEAMFNPSKIMTGPAQRDPLARFMSRIAASMVPYSSALRAARRETDPIARTVDPSDVGGLMGFWQETFDEIRNAVPGWSNELPARRDWINGAPILTMGIMGGEVIPPEMPWLQAAMQFTPLAAFRQGRQSLGPVHEEMGMLSGKGTNFMGPRAADFGPEMRLTPGELEDYITTFATVKDQYGNTFEQAALQLIQSAQYQSWPVDGPSSRDVSLRAAAIQAEIQVFKKLAKEQYKVSTPKGQYIAAEEAAAKGRQLEANYIRQYGMDNSPQPAQTGGSWSPTPAGNR
jgi:hypothetical protein